jgi:tetratricopeptide (TPR) repeat protein
MPKQQRAHNTNGKRPRTRRKANLKSLPDPEMPAPRAAARADGESRLRFQMASLLRLSENLLSRAVSAYDRLLSLDPRDQSEIYGTMASELSSRGNLPEALVALRKAQELSPDDPEIALEIGLLQLKRQAPEAALLSFEQAKRQGASGSRVHEAVADALILLERYEEAVVALRAALAGAGGGADTHYRLGMALDRLGRYSEAVDAFRSALELRPADVAFHQSLGFTLESMGRRDEALRCFKRALELERSPLGPRIASRT